MRGVVPNSMGAARQMNPGQPVMGMQNYMQRPQGQVLTLLISNSVNLRSASSQSTSNIINSSKIRSKCSSFKCNRCSSKTSARISTRRRTTSNCATYLSRTTTGIRRLTKIKVTEIKDFKVNPFLFNSPPADILFSSLNFVCNASYLRSKSFTFKLSFREFRKCRNRMTEVSH
jgi:hypothetical protein